MQEHLFYQNLARILHAHGNHGQAVADKNNIHAGVVGDNGAGKVMRSEDGDEVAFFVLRPQRIDGDFFAGVGGSGAHGGMGRVADLTMMEVCRG